MSSRTPFHLITGFLGSGKTTLLAHLLHELANDRKIAVIQNEFAPTGVDGKTLKLESEDFKLLEINNGSVFCVCQLGNFNTMLAKLLDSYQPDLIFLEASGLADPISVIDLLSAPELRDRVTLGQVINVVDAPNFFRGLNSLQRVRHQLMVADTVILNKTDLYDGDLDEIRNSIRKLNPYTVFKTATQAGVSWDELQDSCLHTNKAARGYAGRKSKGRPDMGACVLRTHDKLDTAGLERFLQLLQPDCLRIKGHLNMQDGTVISIQSIFDQLEVKTLENYSGPTELIAFGHELTAGKLRSLFRECAD